MKRNSILFVSLHTLVSGAVPSLTEYNYESMTAFKSVFIKFFSPGCKLCQSIAEDFEKLSDEWMNSETSLVAEIDCTSPYSYKLCQQHKIEKYPTIKYGDLRKELKEYRDSRKIDLISPFAKYVLSPVCSPIHLELCEPQEREDIERYVKLGDGLTKLIREEERRMYITEDRFNMGKMKLEDRYKEIAKEMNEVAGKERKETLILMKMVQKFRKIKS